MDTDKFFQSKFFRWLVLGTACLIVLTFVFRMGVFVGAKRADFSFRWAGEYHRNFAGPKAGFFDDFVGANREFTNSSGVFGQIIKIGESDLTVRDKDNVEKILQIDDTTTIVFQKNNIKLSGLKVGDNIVVIGEPNDKGQIKAELIRILPPPPR